MSEVAQRERIGSVLAGRYRLCALLGSGGMGAVYEAEEPNGERSAIKILNGIIGGPAIISRFVREARLMSNVSHPNVTRVIDSGIDTASGAPFLVMERMTGEDLDSVLLRCGQLPPVVAVRVVLAAAVGVEAAHAAGVIHRDVKPSNIFLHNEADGGITVKVFDFGIARRLFAAGDTITRSGEFLGTPAYMSPEQARDPKRADGRTDVWSLGVTLYKLLTGIAPFDFANSISELMIMLNTRDAPPLQHKAPWVSEPLAIVTHGALVRDVDDRCPNVGALISALRPLAGGSEKLDARLLIPVSGTLKSHKARRAELPQSWKDVEARVACEAAPAERASTAVKLLGRALGGKYRMLGVLGKGGMGTVYETRGPAGERLAVKVIQDLGADQQPEALARFLREARAVMSITSPHVVRVVDADTDPAQRVPYIVMEMLDGQDLSALVKSAGALEVGPVARLFTQACRGLADAHARGIIHRDIKPANIFLHELPSGEIVAKICDFGVAKQIFATDGEATSVDLTQTGGFLGSPMYFSPEQARNAKKVDHRTDIWSLAASLYVALSGEKPWDGTAIGEIILAVCTQDVPPIQDKAPWITADLAAVVHRGLRRDPMDRYASMEEFAAALEPFTSDARAFRTTLTSVGPAKRALSSTRVLSASISGSTHVAHADTLSANSTDAPHVAKRSRWLVLAAAAMLAMACFVFAVSFRKPLLALARREAFVAAPPPAPSPVLPVATARAAGVATTSAASAAPSATPSATAPATPASAITPSAAPAKTGRRPTRPPPNSGASTVAPATTPANEFLPNQRGN